jgi:6-pyruvoyltetrahydropterin/6-carboxytetrahydropterin synthase
VYTVAVRQDFVAQHYLLGADAGPESELHSHDYRVEVRLEGRSLDEHGYLVDIDVIKKNLDALLAKYHGRTLNEAPEFEGLNPSVEHFARIVCAELIKRTGTLGLVDAVTVRMWEDENAWAAFRQER